MTQPLAAGIDIGGTNTRFGLIDGNGKIIATDAVRTTDYPDPKKLVSAVAKSISQLLTADSKLIGIGIGAPNGNNFKGTIEFAPNLKWKGVIPLADYFQEALNVPALLTNDAKAAALGEMQYGGAKGMKDFMLLTLGTGLGAGVIVNGNPVYGHDGFAGELGHVTMIQHGRQCGCGKKGCLEQYCSATGLVKTYLEILKSENARLPEESASTEVTAHYIYDKALAGNEAAFYAFNYTGDLLGQALANSVTYTSPEAIFLFGGLAQAGELIFTPTILSFEKNLLPIYKRNNIKILPSSLPEDGAAILGAASLVWREKV